MYLAITKRVVIARAHEHHTDGEFQPEAIQLTEHLVRLSTDVKFLHFRLRAVGWGLAPACVFLPVCSCLILLNSNGEEIITMKSDSSDGDNSSGDKTQAGASPHPTIDR